MTKRRNWLKQLQTFVEDTESPRSFWVWSGIFTLAAALERKVWVPYGLEPVYPNLYVMLVAPPAVCRKGPPVGLSKKFLNEIELPAFVDSPTKRALTKQLAVNCEERAFTYEGTQRPMSSIALISKELSSFLAIDLKGMIEGLTDLWDSHDEWAYKTSEKGEDKLYNLCVNCFFATTPSWLAANLPEEAVGGGFTSRIVIVSERKIYKSVPIPPPPNMALRQELLIDLAKISQLVGEFEFTQEAKNFFIDWYNGLGQLIKLTKDRRLRPFIGRIHVMVLKVAMCYHVSYSDRLVLTAKDIAKAIFMLEATLKKAPMAFGGHGKSTMSEETNRILGQIRDLGTVTFSEIVRLNYQDADKSQINEMIDTLIAGRFIKSGTEGAERTFTYNKLKDFDEEGMTLVNGKEEKDEDS